MANFAKLNTDKTVISVVVVDNVNITNSNGIEEENLGVQFLEKITGWPLWKKTSYNTKAGKYYNQDGSEGDQTKAFRKNFAAINYIYDEIRDAFIPLKPIEYNSWILNETSCTWEAPIPYPNTETNGKKDEYTWNETNLSWDKVIYS